MTIIKPIHTGLAIAESKKFGKVEHQLLVYEIMNDVTVASGNHNRPISSGDILVSIKANTDSCFMVAPAKFVYTKSKILGYGRQAASGLYLIGPAFAQKDLKDGLDVVASDDPAHYDAKHRIMRGSMPQNLAWYSFVAETEKPAIEYCDEFLDKAEKAYRNGFGGPMSRNYTEPSAPVFEFFGYSGYAVATPAMNAHQSVIIDVMGEKTFAATLEQLVKKHTDAKPY